MIRIIRRRRAVASKILDLVPHALQDRHQLALSFISSVIRCNGNLHLNSNQTYTSEYSFSRASISFSNSAASVRYNSTSPPIGSSISPDGSSVTTLSFAEGTSE